MTTKRKKLTKGQLVARFIDQAATKLYGADWRDQFTPKQVKDTLSGEVRQTVLSKAQRDKRTAMSYPWANRCYHVQIKKML